MADIDTILVVDDDKAIRCMCRMVLEEAGFRVLEAEDGCQAKTVLAAGGVISLMITDVEMPKLSGPALVKEALAERGGLKVLYMSGSPRENRMLQRHIVECGCGFLAKPFTPEELIGRVHGLLAGAPGGVAGRRTRRDISA